MISIATLLKSLPVLLFVSGAILLTGCATTTSRQLIIYCPPIIEYEKDFRQELAQEVEELPSQFDRTFEALADYAELRDEVRSCIRQRDSE